jgi:hypothetical protein
VSKRGFSSWLAYCYPEHRENLSYWAIEKFFTEETGDVQTLLTRTTCAFIRRGYAEARKDKELFSQQLFDKQILEPFAIPGCLRHEPPPPLKGGPPLLAGTHTDLPAHTQTPRRNTSALVFHHQKKRARRFGRPRTFKLCVGTFKSIKRLI